MFNGECPPEADGPLRYEGSRTKIYAVRSTAFFMLVQACKSKTFAARQGIKKATYRWLKFL